jgi:two-component system CheB/CheR fusion protein
MSSGSEPRFGAVPAGTLIDAATLAMLLDQAYDAVAVRRASEDILYWNKGAERTYGWSAAEAVGLSRHSLLQTQFPMPLAAIEETLTGHGVWEGQLVHTHKDGSQITVDSRWALDAAGGEQVVLEINRDVTLRLAAEESARRPERQLRFITDSAPVLIAHCDLEHRFKFVNRPYAARFGLEPADLIGRRIPEILGQQAYDTIKPYLVRTLAGKRVDVEVEVPYERLGHQFMRFAYEPELDEHGGVIGYVAAIINVSDRRRAEEALREANSRKDAFLATLAHELRNPLAALRNAVTLLSTAQTDAAVSGRADAIVHRQVKQLVRLVEDLLDVSRISRGQLQLRLDRTTPAGVIGSAVDVARARCGITGHRGNAARRIDRARCRHRASVAGVRQPPDERHEIHTGWRENHDQRRRYCRGRDGDGHRYGHRDSFGHAGIRLRHVRTGPQHERPGLRRTWHRPDAGSFHRGSAWRHRDRRKSRDRSGQHVPGAAPTAQQGIRQAEPTPSPSAEAAVSKRVLIADDNLDAAESLQLWLQLAGHDVQIAGNGMEALRVAADFKPDVALLDLGMPGLSGFDVARRIRDSAWGSDMVLVALTGWGQDEDRKQSAEAGFDHHLTKPIAPEAIESLIAGL